MKKIASYGNWSIVVDVGDIQGIAYIQQGNKNLASSEDVFSLLVECPAMAAQSLRAQLVANIINEGGGVSAFQEAVTNNRILFGADFYIYMDEDTLQEFTNQGVILTY
jgi:hypothetical protein